MADNKALRGLGTLKKTDPDALRELCSRGGKASKTSSEYYQKRIRSMVRELFVRGAEIPSLEECLGDIFFETWKAKRKKGDILRP